MRKITIDVKGRTELLMHNVRLANPMDPATKSLAAAHSEWKRAKTDEAFEELCRTEFYGSLYYYEAEGEVIGPYYPTDNLHACLKAAGAKIKKGRASLKNTVAAALLPGESDINPLGYAGPGRGKPAPRSLEALWAEECYRDIRPVRVGAAKIMRTRPIFRSWSFSVPFLFDTEVMDLEDLGRVLTIAGQVIGLGDWRPEKGGRRGRFTATYTDEGAFLETA